MKKILTISLVVLVLIGTFVLPQQSEAFIVQGVGLPITAPSAVLIDANTQRVIYAKAPHARRAPASTTKVLTALVVLDKMQLNQVVRIPQGVADIPPSKAYLRAGEHYRVRDLLQSALISSANDAAEVLGIAAAGSRAKFAQWMNEKARRIGCRDSHFVNPSGLPPGNQYSTVYDLALIMREARKNTFIVDSLSTRVRTIRSLEGRRIALRNHNRLLWRNERPVIGKTGWTQEGQHCFVGRIRWMGRDVLVSLLGSHRLWQDLKVLVDYQFGVALYKVYKNRKHWSQSETKEIQKALARSGFSPGAVDGMIGLRTVRAVELFQKKHRIHPTGILGRETCRQLSRYGLPPNYCR